VALYKGRTAKVPREQQTPVASRARCRRFPPEPRRVAGDLCDNIAAFLSEFSIFRGVAAA
jgi:hypothetical protein